MISNGIIKPPPTKHNDNYLCRCHGTGSTHPFVSSAPEREREREREIEIKRAREKAYNVRLWRVFSHRGGDGRGARRFQNPKYATHMITEGLVRDTQNRQTHTHTHTHRERDADV